MNRKSLTPLVLFLASSTALAQTNKGTGQGLDHLDEQQVMSTLASNNMETLLNRDFDNYKIPEAERDNTRVFIQIRELKNPIGLTIAGRRALAVKVAKGLESILPKANDPHALIEQGNELSFYAILAEVTQLEYFGENPAAQADLKPVAETAKHLYQKAATLSKTQLDALSNGIKDNKDYEKAKPRMDKLAEDQTIAVYSDNISSYSLCIALPKADPQRKSLADESIKYLKNYDTPDTGLQTQVRLLIGKLQLVAATKPDEYQTAISTFDSIVSGKDSDGKALAPPPTTEQQDKARYFRIVAMIALHKLKDAETAITDLDTWEIRNYVPELKADSDKQVVKASLSMLKFRLYSAQSDLTANQNEKKEDNDKAIEVLASLLKEQPGLKELVFDQMLGRLPDAPDFTTLNPLILLALENQAFPMLRDKDPVPLDEKMMNRSISAAHEIINRKGTAGIDDKDVATSAFFIPIGLQTMKMDKEACSAFMDFAEQHKEDPRALICLDRATGIIGALRKKDATDPDTVKLYDRFLPLAINAPYNRRKYFAFTYAAQLQVAKKYKDSVGYYKLVPRDDPDFQRAQYLEMLAVGQQLNDPSVVGPDRIALVNQILDIRTAIDGFLTGAADPDQRKKFSNWVVTADCYAADLTRSELNDPAKSLQILEGFEDRVKDSDKPADAGISALQLRISDFIAQGKVHDATAELVKLSAVNPDKASDLMFSVLKSVETDLNNATAPAAKKQLAQDRAELTGFIVDYTAKSKNPKELERLPSYQLYDADSKREAAELLDDPKQKEAKLKDVLKEYQALTKVDDKKDAAMEGAGLANYDLGNYAEAVKALSPLVGGNKIGTPTVKNAAGFEEENPQYWEIAYKNCKSIIEIYRQKPTDAENQKNLESTRSYVNVLIHQNGEKVGGKTYHDDFLKLKEEIAALQARK